jgi:hypothetical protein
VRWIVGLFCVLCFALCQFALIFEQHVEPTLALFREAAEPLEHPCHAAARCPFLGDTAEPLGYFTSFRAPRSHGGTVRGGYAGGVEAPTAAVQEPGSVSTAEGIATGGRVSPRDRVTADVGGFEKVRRYPDGPIVTTR